MSTVEQVALWAGLISSIIGIVLSIVAIVFAVLVDRSARNVTAQTIKSLQKIESEVDRSSSDTRELIKAAWEKMLTGGMQPLANLQGDAPAKEIAAGVAAELREELKTLREGPEASNQRTSEIRLNQILERLEEVLTAQIRTELAPDQPGTLVEQARRNLEGLSPEAKALVVELADFHLTRSEYKKIQEGPLATAVEELRLAGVLVPLKGLDKAGRDISVYWFPSRLANALNAAIFLITAPTDAIRQRVKAELERIGYRRGE